jgi:hypothetical protein
VVRRGTPRVGRMGQLVPIAFRSGGKAVSVCREARCEMRGKSWEWMMIWKVWSERD